MNKALLIDDDIELADMLVEFLQMGNIELDHACHGEAGLEKLAQSHEYDLVLLDVMMPGINGFEVLKKIRMDSLIPVLMLTAKGDETDKVLGLELGADDYLAKPYSPRELLARVNAILRRVQFEHKKQNTHVITYANLLLNLDNVQASIDGEVLSLTATEFNVLVELFSHLDQVHKKEALYHSVLGREMELFDRSIDMHVSNLRKKLKAKQGPDKAIQTVRGVGYRVESV
jgi:two-component system, OmpR family, response regulator CpxR